MDNPFKNLPPRQLYLLALVIFVFTILASYLYLFKKPLASYANLRQSRLFLAEKIATGKNIADELQEQEAAVARLRQRLHGQETALPAQKLVARNIDRLDQLCNRHGIRLESVRPENPLTVRMFTELPLTIRVSGPYFDLYPWLHEVEKELEPMVIKQFELLPGLTASTLTMNLKLVSYLPVENN